MPSVGSRNGGTRSATSAKGRKPFARPDIVGSRASSLVHRPHLRGLPRGAWPTLPAGCACRRLLLLQGRRPPSGLHPFPPTRERDAGAEIPLSRVRGGLAVWPRVDHCRGLQSRTTIVCARGDWPPLVLALVDGATRHRERPPQSESTRPGHLDSGRGCRRRIGASGRAICLARKL